MDADQIPSTGDPGWYQNFRNVDGSVLTDAVECDNKTCSNEAMFYITTTCCNLPKLSCRGCFETYFAHLDKAASAGYTFKCSECGTEHVPTNMFNKVKKLKLPPA